ncbi:MAG TPA: DUF4244 domain-containing protein [Acidimicrobiia bacterium]|jgi:hypothetical protein
MLAQRSEGRAAALRNPLAPVGIATTRAATLDRDERGQGTVEYFLVILAATCLAVILFRWLQSSGGSGLISSILGKVVSWISGQF